MGPRAARATGGVQSKRAWLGLNQALMTLASDSTNTCSDSSVSLSYTNNWYNYTADGDVTS